MSGDCFRPHGGCLRGEYDHSSTRPIPPFFSPPRGGGRGRKGGSSAGTKIIRSNGTPPKADPKGTPPGVCGVFPEVSASGATCDEMPVVCVHGKKGVSSVAEYNLGTNLFADQTRFEMGSRFRSRAGCATVVSGPRVRMRVRTRVRVTRNADPTGGRLDSRPVNRSRRRKRSPAWVRLFNMFLSSNLVQNFVQNPIPFHRKSSYTTGLWF